MAIKRKVPKTHRKRGTTKRLKAKHKRKETKRRARWYK